MLAKEGHDIVGDEKLQVRLAEEPTLCGENTQPRNGGSELREGVQLAIVKIARSYRSTSVNILRLNETLVSKVLRH